jgi:hypothetical protein
MKKEICGIFHAKCETRDLTKVFGTVPRKAGRVGTLLLYHVDTKEWMQTNPRLAQTESYTTLTHA